MDFKLVIVPGDYIQRYDPDWYIGWESDDGEGVNLYIGEGLLDVVNNSEIDPEIIAAELCMKRLAEAGKWECRDSHYRGAWRIPSKKAAREALAACKAAIKAAASKKPPLEEWEQKALDAGWKPPKGRL